MDSQLCSTLVAVKSALDCYFSVAFIQLPGNRQIMQHVLLGLCGLCERSAGFLCQTCRKLARLALFDQSQAV